MRYFYDFLINICSFQFNLNGKVIIRGTRGDNIKLNPTKSNKIGWKERKCITRQLKKKKKKKKKKTLTTHTKTKMTTLGGNHSHLLRTVLKWKLSNRLLSMILANSGSLMTIPALKPS